MPRIILLAALLAIAPTARAASVSIFFDPPASLAINSGDSFTFAIRMSGAGVASYLIPVDIVGPSGSDPGTDFDVSPQPTAPPTTGYVFDPAPGNFAFTLAADAGPPPSLLLTVGDYSDTEVTDGSGDLVSMITVTTASTFSGKLTVRFGDGFEILDANLDDMAYTTGNGFNVQVGGVNPPVIPEPASAAMMGVGALVVTGLGLRRRRVAQPR